MARLTIEERLDNLENQTRDHLTNGQHTVTMPNKSGTIALLDDLSSVQTDHLSDGTNIQTMQNKNGIIALLSDIEDHNTNIKSHPYILNIIENLQEDISRLGKSVSDGLEQVAEAITLKGKLTKATDSYNTMSNNILQITTESGAEDYNKDLSIELTKDAEKLSNLPYNFDYGSAVVYNNEIHILGGKGYTYNHYKLDKDTNNWVKLDNLPTPLSYGSVFIYKNNITYVNGTYYCMLLDDGTFISKKLPIDVTGIGGLIYNDEVHIFGSINGSDMKHYKLDESTDTWVEISTLPYKCIYGKVIVYKDSIHILGGGTYSYNKTYHYTLNNYSNVWELACSMPYAYKSGSCIVFMDELHIFGGEENINYKIYHYKYNDDTNSWTELKFLTTGSYGGSAVIYRGKVHLLGNETNHQTVDCDLQIYILKYDKNFNIEGLYTSVYSYETDDGYIYEYYYL